MEHYLVIYPPTMNGLYGVVDVATLKARGCPFDAFCRQLLAAQPLAAVQLRGKDLGSAEYLLLLKRLTSFAAPCGVPVFANDRADLAVAAGCTGVHVGQTDLSVPAVRRLSPRLRVGVSTHSIEQLRAALSDRPDYVALGPIFQTASKADADPCVGLDRLAAAYALCQSAEIPLVAIGGIAATTVRAVSQSADAYAAISALVPHQEDGTTVASRVVQLTASAAGMTAPGAVGQ